MIFLNWERFSWKMKTTQWNLELLLFSRAVDWLIEYILFDVDVEFVDSLFVFKSIRRIKAMIFSLVDMLFLRLNVAPTDNQHNADLLHFKAFFSFCEKKGQLDKELFKQHIYAMNASQNNLFQQFADAFWTNKEKRKINNTLQIWIKLFSEARKEQ